MNVDLAPVRLNSSWKTLYWVGGVAALLAGILFRRNIAAEIGLFNQKGAPETVSDWFELLQKSRFLGLVYLNLFDLVNYALLSLMFLALFVALKRSNQSIMTIATVFALLGIAVYYASNTAISMLALSDRFAAASTEAERMITLGAGQALLAMNRFSNPGATPGTGGYISLFLIAVAGLLISILMLRNRIFNRTTAIFGILAGAVDLAYCLAFILLPMVDPKLLALTFIPAGGLMLMVWHILVGWQLCKLGKNR